jgi:hypothetical protein
MNALPGDFTDDIDDSDEIIELMIEEGERQLGRKLTDKEKSDIIKSIRNPN